MNINTFKLHTLSGYVSNIYMAEYDHGILLMDGLAVSDAARVEDYCAKIGRRAEDIKLIVVCHMHPDHSGAATVLRTRYGIPVAAHPAVDRWYSGLTGYLQYKMDLMFTQIYALGRKVPTEDVASSRQIKPDYRLKEGEALPFFPDWSVIYTPGHTRHDISLYNQGSRLMYASDCLVNFNGKSMLPMPLPFRSLMRCTYAKLSSMDIESLLIAHGDAFYFKDSMIFFQSLLDIMDRPLHPVPKWINRIYTFSPDKWERIVRKLWKGNRN